MPPAVPPDRPRANGSLDLRDDPKPDRSPDPSPAPVGAGIERPTILAVIIESDAPMPAGAADDRADEPAGLANVGVEAATPSEGLTLDDYIEWLGDRVDQSPLDTDARWRLAFQQLAVGRERVVADMLADAGDEPGEPGERLRLLIELATALRDASVDSAGDAGEALELVDSLRARLADEADLRVPAVEFCTRVAAFGVYDALPDAQLLPYQSNRVIVYLEVDNFSSQQVKGQSWRTVLNSRMEILTPDGQSLWSHDEPGIEDSSHRRRRDFFLAQLITLPPSLGPGDYVFKVRIEDVPAAKVAESVQPFTVHERSALTLANPR